MRVIDTFGTGVLLRKQWNATMRECLELCDGPERRTRTARMNWAWVKTMPDHPTARSPDAQRLALGRPERRRHPSGRPGGAPTHRPVASPLVEPPGSTESLQHLGEDVLERMTSAPGTGRCRAFVNAHDVIAIRTVAVESRLAHFPGGTAMGSDSLRLISTSRISSPSRTWRGRSRSASCPAARGLGQSSTPRRAS